jgi:hypothetical protein
LKRALHPASPAFLPIALLTAALLSVACRRDMQDQPRFRPFRPSAFFADGRSDRPQVAGTIARGHLEEDELLHRGLVDGKPAEVFPFPVTAEVLERGRERFDIFCAPCHGRVGDGDGMIVQRGMRRPPSYHIDRLRKAPPGYFFDVVTNGFGAMVDLSDRVSAEDRWKIVAYVRALQRSQGTSFDDVPPEERERLRKSP